MAMNLDRCAGQVQCFIPTLRASGIIQAKNAAQAIKKSAENELEAGLAKAASMNVLMLNPAAMYSTLKYVGSTAPRTARRARRP